MHWSLLFAALCLGFQPVSGVRFPCLFLALPSSAWPLKNPLTAKRIKQILELAIDILSLLDQFTARYDVVWLNSWSDLPNSPHLENWKVVHTVRPRIVLWLFCILSLSSFFAGSCSEHPAFEPKCLHQPTWLLQAIEWPWHSGSHFRFSPPGVPTGLALHWHVYDVRRYDDMP